MTTGDKIKFYRKKLNLTQTELGKKLGVKKNAVSKWECGRVDDIPRSKIKLLSELFEVTPAYLIDDEENSPTKSDEGMSADRRYLVDWVKSASECDVLKLRLIVDQVIDARGK